MEFGALIDDDQRVLELACAGRVEAEIGLQRDLDVSSRRHIDEGSAGPYRAVQSREFVVLGRHQFHEVGADHVRIFPAQRALEIRVDDALFGDFLADVVVDKLGVILGADACQGFPLGLGDSQPLESVLDIFRHIVPVRVHSLCVGTHIGDNVVHVEPFDGGTPIGHLCFGKYIQGPQPEFQHPVRVLLLAGDLPNDVRRQTAGHLVTVLVFISKVVERAVSLLDISLVLFHHASPS